MAIRWGKQASEWSAVTQAETEGFDFVQPVGALIADLGAKQFQAQRSQAPPGGLPFTACDVPLPAEARVTQRGFNLYAWAEYLKTATPRLFELGCRKLLWSNGRARLLPPEGDVTDLKEQTLQFLFMLCEIAGSFQITVLVEPLGPRRTNYLNSMREVEDLLARVGKENLSSMISLRELESVDLPFARLEDHQRLIRHVHMENPRVQEGPGTCPRPSDGYDYRRFLHVLKGFGYSGEIGLPSDADADGLAYCREQWEQA